MLSDFENAIKEGLKAEFPQFSVAFTIFQILETIADIEITSDESYYRDGEAP